MSATDDARRQPITRRAQASARCNHDPVALDFVQIKLDRRRRLGRYQHRGLRPTDAGVGGYNGRAIVLGTGILVLLAMVLTARLIASDDHHEPF